MAELTPEQKSKYFDVIYEFGLGDAPKSARSEGRFCIPLNYAAPPGMTGLALVYGDSLEEVCEKAIAWLEPRGWVCRSETMRIGLTNFARGVTNMIAGGVQSGKVEIIMKP